MNKRDGCQDGVVKKKKKKRWGGESMCMAVKRRGLLEACLQL